MNKIEQKIQNNLPESNFSVVAGFIERTQVSLAMQGSIRLALNEGNSDFLVGMGFPEDCIPVMRLWMDQGPSILSSFSHPEELDLDKITATLNLGLFTSRLRASGENVRVLVSEYDTIPVQKSAKRPFGIGNFGLDLDVFGIRQDSTSGRVLTALDRDAIAEKAVGLSKEDPKSSGSVFFDSIRNNMTEEINRKGLASQKKKILEAGRRIVLSRFGEMGDAILDAVSVSDPTIAQVLSRFNSSISNLIYNLPCSADEHFGFERKILSDNTDFLGLVSETVRTLIASRGIGFIQEVVKPGEGIAVRIQGGKRTILSTDEEGFTIDFGNEKATVDDETALQFIENGLPLAKLESLALYAGAMTMHMGSEYGIRPRILEALGFKDRAFNYAMGLRISEDKKHGNLGIVIDPGGYIPTPFAYVLFGRKNLNKLVMAQAGRTTDPIQLSIPDVKEVAADSLVMEALSKIGGIEGE